MTAVLNAISSAIQFLLGLFTPMFGVAAMRWLLRPRDADPSLTLPSAGRRLLLTFAALGLSAAAFAVAVVLAEAIPTAVATAAATRAAVSGAEGPAVVAVATTAAILARVMFELVSMILGYGIVAWQGTDTRPEFATFGSAVRFRFGLFKAAGSLVLLLVSLLPLSSLLLAFPAVASQDGPCVLTTHFPSGAAITVSAPLSRMTAPLRLAAPFTRSIFDPGISPNKRENSPSCGVRMQ